MQELLERQIFEEYKNKILRGIIDEVPNVCVFAFRNNQIHSGGRRKYQLTTTIDQEK